MRTAEIETMQFTATRQLHVLKCDGCQVKGHAESIYGVPEGWEEFRIVPSYGKVNAHIYQVCGGCADAMYKAVGGPPPKVERE